MANPGCSCNLNTAPLGSRCLFLPRSPSFQQWGLTHQGQNLPQVFAWTYPCHFTCVGADSRVKTSAQFSPPHNPPYCTPLLFLFLPPRLLTTDPSQLREEDLPGDLQSLSWLTSVDVPRLQQMADGRGHNNGPSQGGLLEQQTGEVMWSATFEKLKGALWLVNLVSWHLQA